MPLYICAAFLLHGRNARYQSTSSDGRGDLPGHSQKPIRKDHQIPMFEIAPRFLRLAIRAMSAIFPIVASAQDPKAPLPPAAETAVPTAPANPATPGNVPPMRAPKPVVVDQNAPGAPGSAPLPGKPAMPQNEPLFIPDIPGPGTLQLPPRDSGAPANAQQQKLPLERMYTIGKFSGVSR